MVIICFLALLNFSLSGAISSDVPTQLLKYDEFVSTNIRPNHILYSYKQFYWDFRSLISTDKNYYVYRLIDASKDLEFKKTNKLCISMNDCEDRLGLQVLINSLINYTKRSNDFLIYDLNKLSMVFDLLYLTNYSTSKPNNNEIDYLVAEALVNNDIEKFNNQSNSLKDSPLIEQSFNLNDSVISKDLELIYVAKYWSNNTS
ncbi:MAG: hypothetical protein QW076_05545 [Candidatus Anstonellales archaeon]